MTNAVEPVQGPDLDKQSNVFKALLKAAQITQVVVIDDSFNVDKTLDIIAAVQAKPLKFHELIPALEGLGDSDQISTEVESALEQDSDLPTKVWEIMGDKNTQHDKSTMSALNKLASPDVKNLSYQEWEKRENEFLKPNTLIFVDLNFTQENRSEDHGLEVLQKIIAKKQVGIYCALLTHTVTPGEELEKWPELAKKGDIPKDKFVVISKKRLAEDQQDLSGFLHLMRLAILCSPLQEMRARTLTLFQQAVEEAHTQLNDWSVFDFDAVVFGTSKKEGIWEGETLLRVMTSLTTENARKKVRGDELVQKKIEFARGASNEKIVGPSDFRDAGRMALAYQHRELYFDGDYVNKHQLALAVGDLFESGKEKFILLAQPCDLMVRGKKGRARDGMNKMVLLCMIKDGQEEKHGPPHWYELPYWTEERSAWVQFSNIHLIRASMLDLCVLNTDGQANFVHDFKPGTLKGSWRAYAEELNNQFAKEKRRAEQVKPILNNSKMTNIISKEMRAYLTAKTLPCCSNTGKFKVELNEAGFSVNLKRTGRVNSEKATDMLRALAHHQSRTGFEPPVVPPETGAGDET